MACGCQSKCSNCGGPSVATTPCTKDKCRGTLKQEQLAELVYLQGLDDKFCERFQRISDILGLRDCAGNRISIETPIVTCADFSARLCATLALFVPAGVATTSTALVGADCRTYTLPSTTPGIETPNSATDTPTVNITLTGTLSRNIQADVNISTLPDNILTVASDGLYVPPPDPDTQLTACQQIGNFPNAGDAEPGTVLVGADCQKYTFPATDPMQVIDSSSIDLTFVNNVLTALLRLDPTSIGRITADGLQILCSDVLACAPPVTVLDTSTVNLTLAGQQLSAAVIISPTADNDLVDLGNGLWVSVCDTIGDFSSGGVAVEGVTRLVGDDCLTYTLPTDLNLLVQDTTSVDLTLAANILSAVVNLQPNTLLTLGPQGLQVTCEVVQDCAFGTFNNFWTYNDVANSVAFNPSSDAGNQITNGSDGRPFVPAFTLTTLDTDCISLAFIGNQLQANPVISPQAGNALVCQGDGLFVDVPDTVTVVGSVRDCAVTTVSEIAPDVFEVAVQPIISVVPGNQLICDGNGLYVPTPVIPDVIITGQDTNCIDITVTEAPANNFTVSAQPVLSANPENRLLCLADGLFAISACAQIQGFPDVNTFPDLSTIRFVGEETVGPDIGCVVGTLPDYLFSPISGIDTSCINLTVSVPANTIQADLVIDPALGNAAICGPQGLFVPAFSIVALDTECIDTTIVEGPANTFTVSSVPILNPDPCNSLVCTPAGLFVDELPTAIQGQLTTPPLFPPGPAAVGTVVPATDICLNITNPSACRDAVVRIVLGLPNSAVNLSTVDWRYNIVIDRNFNLPGFVVDGGFIQQSTRVKQGLATWEESSEGSSQTFTFTVPPAFVGNFCMRATVNVDIGPIDNFQVDGMLINYDLHTI